jgi:peptide/nickel transport system ATP-binding protein
MQTRRGSLEEIPGTIPNLLSPPPGCRFHLRCPHVMDVCRVDPPPPMRPIGDGTMVACHLYDGGALSLWERAGGEGVVRSAGDD